uniref:B30.2/SPRY domain-containing protein n=1 Tax=Erpetoichthys calabaricus TaxID=27687 RepID=A0A8C4XG84_ERPCA
MCQKDSYKAISEKMEQNKQIKKKDTILGTVRLCELELLSFSNTLEHEKSFTDLIHCIEETYTNLIKKITEQENRETEKAEGVMEQLEKEIEELKRREAELKELSETKDHLHFLQVRDLRNKTLKPQPSSSNLVFLLLVDFLLCCFLISVTHNIPDVVPQVCSTGRLQNYFCPLTLDINTAHRVLRLSEGNKKVTCEGTKTEYPDHPDRFERWSQVLCREALIGTCCYWEVECSGRFMRIGVAYKGLGRKGRSKEHLRSTNTSLTSRGHC